MGEIVRPHNCYLTADVIIHVGNEVLLVRRKNEPFRGMWCIPGGFVDPDEKILDAALRELQEETAVEDVKVIKFDVYGDPGRDPRGRTVTVVYVARLNEKPATRAGDDAAECGWFQLNDLPPMAFDHKKVLEDYHMRLSEGKIDVRA
jgi:8-oxo-dGTP diphosphatase